MMSVKSAQVALQAGTLAGEMEVIAGTGLPGGLMKNASELDSPLSVPPLWGFNVFTSALAGLAIKAAGTAAVITVADTFPELSFTGVVTRFCPFH